MTAPRDPRAAERGAALIASVGAILVLFTVALGILLMSQTSFQSSRAYTASITALHVADAGLQHIPARQNDLYLSPRYLFNNGSYQGSPGPNPLFVDYSVTDPETGGIIGTATRQLVDGKDPRTDPPPYTVQVTGRFRTSTRVIRAQIAPVSLLEYAVYSEDDITMAANLTINGKTYSAGTITLSGPPITFNADVEYVTSIANQGYGTYNGAVSDLASAYPSLTTLVDLNNFETASKATGACTNGIGLYIGPDAGAQHNALFQRSAGVYQIDLTLFDFSGVTDSPTRAIRYNGTDLRRFDNGQALEEFNGIIFVDGELHIWGIDGGRSTEDQTVLDSAKPAGVTRYPGPNGTGNNLYSNNTLDPGEDANGNGVLDARGLGMNLTIVTNSASDIYPDHNIFMGAAPDGRPVRMALIAGDAIHVEQNSPKTTILEAALLARGEDSSVSWDPLGSDTTHQDNYWARLPDATYQYDLDGDGTLEADNGQGQAGDRNETSMFSAWTLRNTGNLITYRRPTSGIWASAGHTRIYQYDPILVVEEPPCYPVIPFYAVVAGTWIELR